MLNWRQVINIVAVIIIYGTYGLVWIKMVCSWRINYVYRILNDISTTEIVKSTFLKGPISIRRFWLNSMIFYIIRNWFFIHIILLHMIIIDINLIIWSIWRTLLGKRKRLISWLVNIFLRLLLLRICGWLKFVK